MQFRSSEYVRPIVLILALCVSGISQKTSQDPGWPRTLTKNGNEMVYYQPQVDEWKDYKDLSGRMAVAVTPANGEQAVGVAYFRLRTSVDTERHTVALSNLEISKTSFPSLPEPAAASLDQIVRSLLPPTFSSTISLDRLVASVDKSKIPPRTVETKNDPPKIFVSEGPAILLQLDGEPVRSEVKDTKLEAVMNSNFPLFAQKKKDDYYLLVGTLWLTSKGLQGSWTPAKKLPDDVKKITKDPKFKDLGSLPTSVSEGSGPVPQVFYSSVPAELILFKGQPVYGKIETTNLVYATNTDNDVFVHSPTKTFYYLTAGRWFSTKDLNRGPWKYASPDLPDDFSKIPRSSPAARVMMFVPGTAEAADAVLMAQVPTKVVLDPKKAAAQVKVSYAGDPQFKPIEGTSLQYAANTGEKVIKVGNDYYVCYQGAWFKSTSPQGPWQAAESVPKEIYSIPPSSPVYNVTYVTQTTTSDGDVEASYTAGYMGMFVTGMAIGTVIGWGTGYYYPPYYYPSYGYYYGYPRTYGVGYYGAYGGGYGVYGPYGGARYGAGYNPATGTYGRGASAYGPYGSARAGQAYNPYTGSYARGASASTAYGSRRVGESYNPSTGTYRATRQSSNPYSQWGSSAVSRGGETAVGRHYSDSRGTVGSVQTSSGGAAVGARGASGAGAVGRSASGDLYAGRDGNVYKQSGGSWQQYNNGSWQNVDAPSSPSGQRAQELQQQRGTDSTRSRPDTSDSSRSRPDTSQMQSLNRDSESRQRGAAQSQRFESSQRSYSGGSSRSFSGGRRGGGRRR